MPSDAAPPLKASDSSIARGSYGSVAAMPDTVNVFSAESPSAHVSAAGSTVQPAGAIRVTPASPTAPPVRLTVPV